MFDNLKHFFFAPETQMSITGGAVVAYISNPEHWVFLLTVTLLALQIGLALHKYVLIWKTRREKKRGKQT